MLPHTQQRLYSIKLEIVVFTLLFLTKNTQIGYNLLITKC